MNEPQATHQASRAEHQGTEAEPRPCQTCQGQGYVPVRVPVTGDMEADAGMEPGSGGHVTVSMACYTCNRSGEAPGGGMAQLERDVIAVPRDTDAKRLVEAILKQARPTGGSANQLSMALAIVCTNAERLAVLLDERGAEREELVTAILKLSGNIPSDRCVQIHAHAERLAVLLAEPDAERETMKLILARTLGALQGVRDSYPEHHWPTVNAIIEEADEFVRAARGGAA